MPESRENVVEIPCLRAERAPALEPFSKDDPSVSYCQAAADASVRLVGEYLTTAPSASGSLEVVKREGHASGALVSPDGLILTCDHIFKVSNNWSVELNSGEVAPAHVVFRYPCSDLAILQIERANKSPLPYLELAKDKLKVNKGAAVIGHPKGLRNTYISPGNIQGVKTAKEYFDPPLTSEFNQSQNIIKLDCHIEKGSSGSPVLNADGKVIGISFAGSLDTATGFASSPNQSFAMPISKLKEALKKHPDLLKKLTWK